MQVYSACMEGAKSVDNQVDFFGAAFLVAVLDPDRYIGPELECIKIIERGASRE